MKPVTIDIITKNIVGWVYDFKNDYDCLPNSLDDLSEKKAEKHSYNPKRVFQLNQKLGFDAEYKILDDGSFEVLVYGSGKLMRYLSRSDEYLLRDKP